MELTNEFRVGVPVEEAWTVLTDVERIAPCLPGAQLTEVDGDRYTGNVKVKVGPITAQYKGTATFVEKDEVGRRVVLKADGRDTRGQGNASAMVTATLVPEGDGTLVTVQTDLTVTGKVAQFGRGVLADVSAKLIGQFVQSLEADVLSGTPAASDPVPVDALAATGAEAAVPSGNGTVGAPPVDAEPAGTDFEPIAAGTGPTAAPVVVTTPTGPRKIDSPDVAPVDLLGTAGAPVVKRVGPVVGVLVVVVWLLRRRSHPSARVVARRARRLAAASAVSAVAGGAATPRRRRPRRRR